MDSASPAHTRDDAATATVTRAAMPAGNGVPATPEDPASDLRDGGAGRSDDGDGFTGQLLPGVLLDGRYRLGDRIGAGGMATIMRARDETLERDVAVKILHAHLADDADLRARFRTEARHAAALSHPNIVNVYDQGVAGLPYIVLEYVDGPSLREVLRVRGRLTPSEALAIIAPLCEALARAHTVGVIHRDLKPENVLISSEGTPKVADFGIARAMAATSHTQTGTLIGSVHYLAPELVDGADASAASDTYALGVVLFELLTGRKALPADSPMAVALRHAQEMVPPPSAYASEVPAAVDEVVATATAMDPEDRYRDLLAFAAALRSAVPDGPEAVVVAGPAEGGQQDTLVIPADHQETASMDAVGDVGTRRLPPSRRHRPDAAPEMPPPSRPPEHSGRRLLWRRPTFWAAAVLVVAALTAGGGWSYWNYVVAPVTEVPPVEDLTADEARAAVTELGLEFTVDGEPVHTLDEAAGEVLEQTPAPGESLRRGETVSVTVSAGPAPVNVDDYVGLASDQALAALEDAVLEAEVTEVFDEAPAGEVIAQEPEPGTTLVQTDTVSLTVSKGIEQITVPDVSGLTREEAEQELTEARLEPEFSSTFSDEVPEAGRVVSQDLEAESQVDVHSVVQVTVSRGPLTISMPNVRGQGVKAARAQLEELGLEVSVEGQPRPSFGPIRQGKIGLVEEQLPSPEKAIQRGSPVTLYTFDE